MTDGGLRIVPFRPDHVRRMRPQAAQAADALHAQTEGLLGVAGPAFALERSGEPIALAGVRVLRPGVGLAWALLSEDALKRPATLVRSCRRGLTIIERTYALRRIEATASECHKGASRFLEALGFAREGLMRNYGRNGIGHYSLHARTTE